MDYRDHHCAIRQVSKDYVEPLRQWLLARLKQPFPVECPMLHIALDSERMVPTAHLQGKPVSFQRAGGLPMLIRFAARRKAGKPGLAPDRRSASDVSDVRTALRRAGLPDEFNIPPEKTALITLRIPAEMIVLAAEELRAARGLKTDVLDDLQFLQGARP